MGSHMIRNVHCVFLCDSIHPVWATQTTLQKYFLFLALLCRFPVWFCVVTVNPMYIIKLFAFHEHRLGNIPPPAWVLKASYFIENQIRSTKEKKCVKACWVWILHKIKSFRFTGCSHNRSTDCNMKSCVVNTLSGDTGFLVFLCCFKMVIHWEICTPLLFCHHKQLSERVIKIHLLNFFVLIFVMSTWSSLHTIKHEYVYKAQTGLPLSGPAMRKSYGTRHSSFSLIKQRIRTILQSVKELLSDILRVNLLT